MMRLFLPLLFAICFCTNARAETFSAHDQSYPTQPLAAAQSGTALYLHLKGQDREADPSQTFKEMNKRFLKALYNYADSLSFSYVMQASGGGFFTLNLIVEPATEGAAESLQKYLADCGEQHFHEVLPVFQKVEKVFELAIFEAGVFKNEATDPFEQHFSLQRGFSFPTLEGWKNFTNAYGHALLNPKSEEFLGYFESFMNSKEEFLSVRDQVLTQSDMVAVEPKPYLLLEGDKVAGPDWDSTPFIPFKFYRNCWSEKYEHGMCFSRPKK
jgi:hypothetical protein